MKTPTPSILKKTKTGSLITMTRRFKNSGSIMGFVVGVSDTLLILHTLDTDAFQLNGYIAVRTEDVSKCRVFDQVDSWWFRAMKHFDLTPIIPVGISIASLHDLIQSVATLYPLITFHPEEKKPDVCFIGPLLSMTERTFTIDDLNSTAQWTGPRRMRFHEVTRVDFGDGYAKALAVVAPKRSRSKNQVHPSFPN